MLLMIRSLMQALRNVVELDVGGCSEELDCDGLRLWLHEGS